MRAQATCAPAPSPAGCSRCTRAISQCCTSGRSPPTARAKELRLACNWCSVAFMASGVSQAVEAMQRPFCRSASIDKPRQPSVVCNVCMTFLRRNSTPSSMDAGSPMTVVERTCMCDLLLTTVAHTFSLRRPAVQSCGSTGVVRELLDGARPGVRRRVHEAVRSGHGGEPAVGGQPGEFEGPLAGADAVLVAVQHQQGDGDPRDDVLEPVGQVHLQHVAHTAQAGPLPLRGVHVVEAGRLERVVAPPGEQDPSSAAEPRVHRRAGEDDGADTRRPGGGDPGDHLRARRVPDEDDPVEPARAQPLSDGVGELGDVHRVRWLPAAREAGQLDEVGTGPAAQRPDGGQQVLGDGQPGDDDHLGHAVPRPAHRPAPQGAPGGGAVRDLGLGRHAFDAMPGFRTRLARGRRSTPPFVLGLRESVMPKRAAGMSKQSMARALGATGAAFGLLSVLAPRAVARSYGVPITPGGLQLQRLFGSRALAISVLALTAKTDEETDRGLAAVAGVNALDTLTALANAGSAGGKTTTRAVLSSLAYGAAALAIRAQKK